MGDRPKTSRGAPAYANSPYTRPMGGAGVSTSHRSTEELLRLADAQIKARKGTPSVGGSLSGLPSQGKSQKAFQVSSVGGGGGTTAMSYDASRKTRSSTETYLNNLQRKALTLDDKDDDDFDGGRDAAASDDDDIGSTSTSTIGRGGSEFLKKPTKVAVSKNEDAAPHSSSKGSKLMSSSDEEASDIMPSKKGDMASSKNKMTSGNEKRNVEADLSDQDEDNSIPIEALIGQEISVSDNSSSLAKKADEEYDYFDPQSPPKTPVSARKEVRFSTQLSIASGEDNISVIESVMDTASIADTPRGGVPEASLGGITALSSGLSANHKSEPKSSIKTLQSEDEFLLTLINEIGEELEMEINLGIEEILPATVKPDKTPMYDMSSDYDEDLDKLTQNTVFDVDELIVGDSPNLQSPTHAAPDSKSSKPPKSRKPPINSSSRSGSRARRRRRGSSGHGSRSSEQESAAEEEILSESEDDGSTSHSEELMSIGNLHDPQQLESFRAEVAQHKQVARVSSLDYNSADNEENRPASKASLYSQDSFDDVSTTEPPYSDFNEESEMDTTDHDKSHASGDDVQGSDKSESDRSQSENQSEPAEKGAEKDPSPPIQVTAVEVEDADDVTSSFPTYSATEPTADKKREAESRNGHKLVAAEKVQVNRSTSEVRTDHQYLIQKETESSIDRVFHQIVTVQPKSVASMVVEKETIDALTNFNPASVALTSFMRSHLDATRKFIDNTRRLHEQYQQTLLPDYHYTTIHDDAKQRVRTRSSHSTNEISLEEAIDRVERNMGEKFSEEKRQKIRDKIAQMQGLPSGN